MSIAISECSRITFPPVLSTEAPASAEIPTSVKESNAPFGWDQHLWVTEHHDAIAWLMSRRP